ncbi:hypothetical protein ACFQE5_10020 [Pseudonocardia hispaniensis]|uniref:Uncharacterized protein n=1 Tax=Pseudonocardia hispaniensis TaxID=904933 RepID=A0ABW1J1A7_9PSEU
MTRTGRLAAATALCALLVGGCSTVVTGTPGPDPAPAPTEGPGSDPVAWADRVCGSVLAYSEPALARPAFTDVPDLPGIQKRLSDYLATVLTGLQQGRTQLDSVGRSPVTGGDEALVRIGDVFRQLEADLAAVKAQVDGADPNNADAFKATLAGAQDSLAKVTTPDSLASLARLPRLAKATQKAVNCQRLATLPPAT